MSGALLTDSRAGSQQTAGTSACKISMPIVNNMNTSSNGHGAWNVCMVAVASSFRLLCSLLELVQSDIQTKHSGYASTTDRTRLLMHYHDETCHLATGDAMYNHSHSMTVQLAAHRNPRLLVQDSLAATDRGNDGYGCDHWCYCRGGQGCWHGGKGRSRGWCQHAGCLRNDWHDWYNSRSSCDSKRGRSQGSTGCTD